MSSAEILTQHAERLIFYNIAVNEEMIYVLLVNDLHHVHLFRNANLHSSGSRFTTRTDQYK